MVVLEEVPRALDLYEFVSARLMSLAGVTYVGCVLFLSPLCHLRIFDLEVTRFDSIPLLLLFSGVTPKSSAVASISPGNPETSPSQQRRPPRERKP
jgi:hypothetical protein